MSGRYRPSTGTTCPDCGGFKHYQSVICQDCWVRGLDEEPELHPISMTPADVSDAVALAEGSRPPRNEDEELKLVRGSQMLAAVIKTGWLPHPRRLRHVDDARLSAKDRADIERERAGRRNREAA